jgi:MFS family permease
VNVRSVAAAPAVDAQTRTPAMSGAVVLLVASVFISYVDRGNVSVAAPLLTSELGMSISQLGILLSAFFWSYTLMLFTCAVFMDRWDANRVLLLGCLLWSIATALTGLIHGFAMLLLMRVLLGLGESVTFPSYSKILAQHLPETRRGFANGAIIAGMKLGPAAGTLVVGLLIARYGWRPVFVGLGLLGILWLPAWRVWMPRTRVAGSPTPWCPPITLILKQRAFWATVIGGFCVAYPLYFMVTWLPYYLMQEQHLAMPSMVRIAALYYLVDASAAFATGCTTDALIRRGIAAGLVRKGAMVLGWSAAACGFAGCAWVGAQHYVGWLLFTGVSVGVGNSGLFAFSQTLAGRHAIGRWVCVQNGFANLAGVLGPALTGFTVEWTGNFRLAITITAGTCLIGAFTWLCLVGEFREVNWGADQPQRSASGQLTL